MKRDYLQIADPAWPAGTILQVTPPHDLGHAPMYIWREKEQDFYVCGFVRRGELAAYLRSWLCRGVRYAECELLGAPAVLLQAHLEPAA